MNPQRKQIILKSLRYWAGSFAITAGLFYYKSTASLGAVLMAGIGTLFLTLSLAYYKRPEV